MHFRLYAALAALLVSSPAAAALEGRYLETTPEQGFDAYYDPDTNLTWLADANYLRSHCASKEDPQQLNKPFIEKILAAMQPEWLEGSGRPGIDVPTDLQCHAGTASWPFAMAFVKSLEIGGISGWTLPPVTPVNDKAFDRSEMTGKTALGITSTKSPLPRMMHAVLGVKATGGFNPAVQLEFKDMAISGVMNGVIRNVSTGGDYWMQPTVPLPAPSATLCYKGTMGGMQNMCVKTFGTNALIWPVHAGDVGRKPMDFN